MFDLQKNFTRLTVSGNYSAADTNITISGSNLTSLIPNSGSGIFSVVWYDSTNYPSVYNDPNKEICRVTGISNQTLFLTRGQEYTNGNIHSGSTYKMIVTPTARGFNNLYYFRNPEKSYYMFDDFLGPLGNVKGMTAQQNGSFYSPNLAYTFNQQLGVWGFGAGTTVGSYVTAYYGADSYLLGSGLIIAEGMINFFNTNDNIPNSNNPLYYIFGFNRTYSVPISTTDGVWFEINNSSSNYLMKSSRNGVFQTGNTNYPYSTGWHKYNIVINQVGSKADFYVDDILIGAISGNTIPISSTSFMTSVYREALSTATYSGQNGTGYVDYVSVYKELQALNENYGATGYNFRL